MSHLEFTIQENQPPRGSVIDVTSISRAPISDEIITSASYFLRLSKLRLYCKNIYMRPLKKFLLLFF